jgi:hypothetical protein
MKLVPFYPGADTGLYRDRCHCILEDLTNGVATHFTIQYGTVNGKRVTYRHGHCETLLLYSPLGRRGDRGWPIRQPTERPGEGTRANSIPFPNPSPPSPSPWRASGNEG